MFLHFLPRGLGGMIIYNRFLFLKELHCSVQLQQDVGILELNICSVSIQKGIQQPVPCSSLLRHIRGLQLRNILPRTCMATSFLILHLQLFVHFRIKLWNLKYFKFMGIPQICVCIILKCQRSTDRPLNCRGLRTL